MVSSRAAHTMVALSVALFGSGCFKSYVAISLRPPAGGGVAAEVHETARMQELRPTLRSVAVRAPSACLAEGGAPVAGPGVVARSRTILEARCEVVLGELERALSERFRVVPWRELVEAEKAAPLAGLAAQKTAADLVLVVTDLAATPLLVTDLQGGVVLTRANPDGSPRGTTPLPARSEKAIRELVAERLPGGGLGGVAVQLEVVAFAAGGEPVWRYQHRVAADLDGARDLKMLVRGRAATWRPVEPRGKRARASASLEDSIRARLRTLAGTLAREVAERLSTAS